MSRDPEPMPDAAALMRMATAYLARYAASSHRLRAVLERRIHRRCAASGLEPPEPSTVAAAIDDLLGRLSEMGLVDDQAFAAGRARSLRRKGFAKQRIRLTLNHEGLSTEAIDGEDPVDDEAQARRFAERKRLGPFRLGDRVRFRDKDLRALQRAGFAYAVAVATVDAAPEET